MRKGIKIKACMVFAAWGMIFLHNVIPHIHPQENSTGCHELVHNADLSEGDCSGPLKYKSEPGDIHVCHISNFLYNQIAGDSYVHPSEGINEYLSPIGATSFHFCQEQAFIREIYSGTAAFRAPPSA